MKSDSKISIQEIQLSPPNCAAFFSSYIDSNRFVITTETILHSINSKYCATTYMKIQFPYVFKYNQLQSPGFFMPTKKSPEQARPVSLKRKYWSARNQTSVKRFIITTYGLIMSCMSILDWRKYMSAERRSKTIPTGLKPKN